MRRVLVWLAGIAVLAVGIGGVAGYRWARSGPELAPAMPAPPSLTLHPRAARPGTTLRCTSASGAAVRWTVDDVDAGTGPTLVAPERTGAVVRCFGGPGEADRVVVGAAATAGNVLLVILDDVGVDKVRAYDPTAPPTPTLDALAAEGVRFTNAWSEPVCSPARTGILTGLDATNHGVGRVIDADEVNGLALGVRTLPRLLLERGYHTGALGKWHVTGEPAGLDALRQLGFHDFQGTWGNLEPPETRHAWKMTGFDGRTRPVRGYVDTVTADLARTWIDHRTEPWMLWLAFHGAHAPWDPPPPGDGVPAVAPDAPAHDRYDAVLTAVDRELGRVLASMSPEVRARTTVVVIGDNGTAWQAVRPPHDPDHAKGTLYELGVHVPLIVTGPLVPPEARGRVADGLVSHVDLLPTLVEGAGIELPDDVARALDGVSFLDLLARPDLPSRRAVLYAEVYEPRNASPPWRRMWRRAVRDERYTLIETLDGPAELYDLWRDPEQERDLLRGTPSPEVEAARLRLHDAMWVAMTPKPADVVRPPDLPRLELEVEPRRPAPHKRGGWLPRGR